MSAYVTPTSLESMPDVALTDGDLETARRILDERYAGACRWPVQIGPGTLCATHGGRLAPGGGWECIVGLCVSEVGRLLVDEMVSRDEAQQ